MIILFTLYKALEHADFRGVLVSTLSPEDPPCQKIIDNLENLKKKKKSQLAVTAIANNHKRSNEHRPADGVISVLATNKLGNVPCRTISSL